MNPLVITPSDFTTSRYLGNTFSLAKAMENLASSSASSAILRRWSRSSFARDDLEHFGAHVPHAHHAPGHFGRGLQHADDVAHRIIGIRTQEEVGARQ